MANIKLKNSQGVEQVYENVNEVLLPKADGSGNISTFLALGQMTTFVKDNMVDIYVRQDNPVGVATMQPTEPTKEGYWFKGWSLSGHEYISANKVVLPFTFNEDTTLYAMWVETPSATATITGFGSENISSIQYNIDAQFPLSFDEETDQFGNIFVKIPTIYRKIIETVDGQITAIQMSTRQIDSTYVPYSCFVRPNGTVAPYILIGKYCMSSTEVANSVNATAKTMTISVGRGLARARGNGYQLYDWQIRQLFNDLTVAFKRTVKVNDTTILGIAHWNNNIWIDGFCHNSADYYICYDPSKYVDSPTASTTGYSKLSYSMPTSTTYIKKLGYDSNHPFAQFPAEGGGTSETYYPDQSYYFTGNRPVLCRVGSAGADYGLFYFGGGFDWSSASSCRLCYRPI